MDTLACVFRAIAQAVPMMLAPKGVVRGTDGNVLALSGYEAADLNMLFLSQPDAGLLEEGTALARERALPFLILAGPLVVLPEIGQAAPDVPVMFLDGAVEPQNACAIEPVRSDASIRIAAQLQSDAFALPLEAMTRLLEESLRLPSPPSVWIASRDGVPMSSVTMTHHGDMAGIWTMATPQRYQRQGVGRALLTRVLAEARRRGIAHFFLIATPAGAPLYTALGFRTLASCKAVVINAAARNAA